MDFARITYICYKTNLPATDKYQTYHCRSRMKKLVIAGVLSQPFGSWPVVSQTDNALVWDQFTIPFVEHNYVTAMASDGNSLVISNQNGFTAVTENLTDFQIIELDDGFGTRDMIYQATNKWFAVGTRIYSADVGAYENGDEVAQIYKSPSAYGQWSMIWTHNNRNSHFYQIREVSLTKNNLPFPVLVVCGSVDNIGDAWYSTDLGSSWVKAAIPAGVSTIYSVQRYSIDGTDIWLWGSVGKIFISNDLISENWSEIELNEKSKVIDMRVSSNGTTLVINGQDKIYWTYNGASFYSFVIDGYVFDRIELLTINGVDKWVFYARSTLTQYTFWSTEDFKTFTPDTNSMHVQASIVLT
jgi:hypothetical protein